MLSPSDEPTPKFYYPSILESASSNEQAEGLRRRRLGNSYLDYSCGHLAWVLPGRPVRADLVQHEHLLIDHPDSRVQAAQLRYDPDKPRRGVAHDHRVLP